MAIHHIEDFFKPEVRKRGADEFAKDWAVLAHSSDTQITAYVQRKSKVSLASLDIASASLTAQCSCPQSAKKQLCRHIWAVLMAVDLKSPDFLECKTTIEILATAAPTRNQDHKARQSEFRKEQYQKMKQKMKDRKQKAKEAAEPIEKVDYPAPVESALGFFADQGYPVESSLNEETLRRVWKKLSVIFHPDRGGTHQEAVILNENFETLRKFLNCDLTEG